MEILVRSCPDEYRGSLDCIEILTDVQLVLEEDNEGLGDVYAVMCDGEKVAELIEWYGNGGKGKHSADEIVAMPGHEIVWIDEWES